MRCVSVVIAQWRSASAINTQAKRPSTPVLDQPKHVFEGIDCGSSIMTYTRVIGRHPGSSVEAFHFFHGFYRFRPGQTLWLHLGSDIAAWKLPLAYQEARNTSSSGVAWKQYGNDAGTGMA
jgi:hypothetical protein